MDNWGDPYSGSGKYVFYILETNGPLTGYVENQEYIYKQRELKRMKITHNNNRALRTSNFNKLT